METLQATADATALTARIATLIDANRPVAARHLLSAVRRLVPDSPAIAELAARVAVGEGRLPQALAELDAAIAEFPDLPYREADVRPFRFFYRVRDETVWIVAVWHGAQVPEEPDDSA